MTGLGVDLEIKYGFGSDNHSSVHPKLFAALADAQQLGHLPSYGTDDLTKSVIERMRMAFGGQPDIHFVFNGTAANVLALATSIKSYEAVICSEHAHLQNDECSAPEKLIGCKLLTCPAADAKLTPQAVRAHLIRRGDQHSAQAKVISITQPTEYGTVYTLDELRALVDLAQANGLYVHIDGARFCQAVHYLKTDLRSLTSDLGIDVLSFGGTKNGFMFGEAVIVFNPRLKEGFKFLRKQFLQLPSKGRFLAAQFGAYFENELYLEIARHGHKQALRLAAGLRGLEDQGLNLTVTQAVQSNAVFVRFPKHVIAKLREHSFFYIWDEKTFEARLMMSFDTTDEHIDGFLAHVKKTLGD